MCQTDADSTQIGEMSSVLQYMVCCSRSSKVERARVAVTGGWRKEGVQVLDRQLLDCHTLCMSVWQSMVVYTHVMGVAVGVVWHMVGMVSRAVCKWW